VVFMLFNRCLSFTGLLTDLKRIEIVKIFREILLKFF